MSKTNPYKPKTANAVKKKQELPLIQEIEIIYSAPKIFSPIKIDSSRSAYTILKEIYDLRKVDYKEFFYVLLLNRANYCIGVSQIGMGSTTATVVNHKEIFHLALKSNATAAIITHNHPSGNLNPSEADKVLTSKIKKGCELFDVNLIDHIIFTSNGYYSFADEGII